MSMPTFETERTFLRPFTLDDAHALNQVNKLHSVMRYIGPTETEEQTRDYLINGPLADYQQWGYGRHAVIDKASEQLIGFCGLKYLADIDETDIGYRLLPSFWGQGLATETALALMDYAKSALQLTRIIALALPDNHASINIFPKLGLEYEKDIVYAGETCVLWSWQTSS